MVIDLEHCTNDVDTYRGIGLDPDRFALWNIAHMGKPHRLADILSELPDFNNFEKVFLVTHQADLLQLRDILPNNCHCWEITLYQEPVSRYHTYLYWSHFVTTLARDTGAIDKLTDPLIASSPEFLFDCLLGGQRPHRDFIHACVNTCAFADRLIYSYGPVSPIWLSGSDADSQDFVDVSENSHDATGVMVPTHNLPNCSTVWVRYSDRPVRALLSLFIPWRLYNNSWFTIVADTDHESGWPYHSPEVNEKIAKPLVAKRLFVYFGAPQMLHRLQQFGFKTFGAVIDESYDHCLDNQQRWQQAWQQVEYLAAQDPREIYQAVLPVLEHNQRLMLSRDWRQEFLNDVRSVALDTSV